jgi:chromosomal replication initiation ATPase DnaA
MFVWENIQSWSSKFQTFDNFITHQQEALALKTNCINSLSQTIISGKSGDGVSHLLHAICNKWIENGRNILYISGQSLIYVLKKLKSQIDIKNFQSHLLSFEMLAIDNLQHFYKKSVRYSQFVLELIIKCKNTNKPLFLGCSNTKKDFTLSKKYSKLLSLQRIDLKPLSSRNVFRVLKNLCKHEPLISDELLYVISGYNGSVQQYINCLVSIRFKSKCDGINIKLLSPEKTEKTFNIKSFFPKQQLRKCFNTGQYSVLLIENEYCNHNIIIR